MSTTNTTEARDVSQQIVECRPYLRMPEHTLRAIRNGKVALLVFLSADIC